MLKAATIKIGGSVQGVGFRYFVQRVGSHAGVTGYVRNFEDDVEVYAEGTEEQLNNFAERIKQGPPQSRVTHFSFQLQDLKKKKYNTFNVTF